MYVLLPLLLSCTRAEPTPGVGDRWTDMEVVEVAWWRDLTWTVAATGVSASDGRPAIRAWLLHNEEPDGSWVDAAVGVVRIDGVPQAGALVTRGWVTRSDHARLELERAPKGEVVRVGVRHACPGGEAGEDVFFRVLSDRVSRLAELTTVDPTQECAAQWTSSLVSGEPLVFETTIDGERHRFRRDGDAMELVPGP